MVWARGEHRPGLVVSGDGEPTVKPNALSWHATIPARGEWTVTVEVVPTINGVPMTLRFPCSHPAEHTSPALMLREWRRRSPDVRTADRNLAAALRPQCGGYWCASDR
jgi:hypothetical protein